jgi:transposase InsO family protein
MNKIYFDPKHRASFGGLERLKRDVDAKKSDVSKWLQSQRVYTLHKPARRKYVTRRTLTSHFASQFQADLNDMIAHSRVNRGYRYILTVIDVFSRKGWALPLKTKSGSDIVKAFRKIFQSATTPPHTLQTDQGKEFLNHQFQSYLRQHKVLHFYVPSHVKASLVERWNRTLKTRMFRYFTHKGSYKWVDVLQDLVESYNTAPHSSLPRGMSPLEAAKQKNHFTVWKHQESFTTPSSSSSSLRVGDHVRISKVKKTFEKGYLSNWSEEIFKIFKVDERTTPTMYVLQDLDNNEIEGKFYAPELQQIPAAPELFAVERVIRRDKKSGKYLVKFLGYTGQHWVNHLERYK